MAPIANFNHPSLLSAANVEPITSAPKIKKLDPSRIFKLQIALHPDATSPMQSNFEADKRDKLPQSRFEHPSSDQQQKVHNDESGFSAHQVPPPPPPLPSSDQQHKVQKIEPSQQSHLDDQAMTDVPVGSRLIQVKTTKQDKSSITAPTSAPIIRKLDHSRLFQLQNALYPSAKPPMQSNNFEADKRDKLPQSRFEQP